MGMFNIGGGELILVALAALLLIKPENLPNVATTLGRWHARLRQGIAEIKSNIQDTLKDEPPSPPKK